MKNTLLNLEIVSRDELVPEKYLLNKCRICLIRFGEIPIFGNDTLSNISEDILTFGNISIHIDDQFSKLLCNFCYDLLNNAISFRNTAVKSDSVLREIENVPNSKIIRSSEFKTETNEQEVIPSSHKEVLAILPNNKSVEVTNRDHKNEEASFQCDNDTNQFINNTETFKCLKCNQNNSHNKNCPHYKPDHKKNGDVNKIECHLCEKVVPNLYLKQHLTLHSKEQNNTTILCEICNKSYSKSYFKNHITHAHGSECKKPRKKLYTECPVCKKTYEQQYYKFHIAIHNTVRKYVCDTCGKSFIQQSAFKRHSLIHGSELAYKCHLCPYRGRHPGLVKTHMKIHTKDYRHQCTECSAQFLTKSNLNKHLQRHKGPVDFKCNTCARGFYSKLELERHYVADHLGVKDHVCNICGKAFGYRNAMMNHQLKVHKREKLTNGRGRQPLYKRKDEIKK